VTLRRHSLACARGRHGTAVTGASAICTQRHMRDNAMTPYGNRSGDSGVAAYECRADEIRLRFVGGATIYVYTGVAPGSRHVRAMQRLATAGKGLATYVNQHVRDDYEYTID
jgi:hypothetical protein